LTKNFKDKIPTRAQRDSAFRKVLLQEGVECLLAGDIDTGKAVLRDYINATIGFEELSLVFDKSSKSLMRMFGPKGNPQASNLFAVISYLQEQEGIHLEVKALNVAKGYCCWSSIGKLGRVIARASRSSGPEQN